MGPIHLVWALAAIYPRWGNRYFAATKMRSDVGRVADDVKVVSGDVARLKQAGWLLCAM